MSKKIKPDYSIQFLMPPSFEDWVPPDHPARFIRDFVDILDLDEMGFKVKNNLDGRPSYSEDLLLKVMLYCYLKRVRSFRMMEEACRDNMALIWLTGNNVPDHNTIWRFVRDNKSALKEVYRKTVKVALKADLVGMVVHAVDGTKIRSRGSNESLWSRGEVEELLKKLDESIDETLEGFSEIDDNEFDYHLPDDLTERGKLQERLKAALAAMDETERTSHSETDPESRIMKNDGRLEPGYNAQAVVEGKNGLIVAEDVVNEESDKFLLTPMIDEVVENTGHASEETLADAGYYSSKELAEAEEKKYSVLVNPNPVAEGEFHWSRFRIDRENDCVYCPLGTKLVFSYIDRTREPHRRVYLCKECRKCDRRWDCSKSKHQGRKIKLLPNQEVLSRNHERLRDPILKDLLRKRKMIIEPVFGVIKECMGFRRWTYFGLEAVKVQWSMVCAAYNLKKLMRFWKDGRLKMLPV